MSGTSEPATLRDRLAAALPDAMRRRDAVALSALRGALAAIANAEAVHVDVPVTGAPATSSAVAGTVEGLGSTEVPRRELDEAEIRAIVLAEAGSRTCASRSYSAAGEHTRSDVLRAEADLLRRVVDDG